MFLSDNVPFYNLLPSAAAVVPKVNTFHHPEPCFTDLFFNRKFKACLLSFLFAYGGAPDGDKNLKVVTCTVKLFLLNVKHELAFKLNRDLCKLPRLTYNGSTTYNFLEVFIRLFVLVLATSDVCHL